MKTFMFSICFVFLSSAAFSQSSSTTKDVVFDDAAKVFGLSRLCTEIKYNCAYYDQLTLDWDSLCYSFIPALLATETPWDYYKEMQRLCAMLEDGHTTMLEPETTDDDVIRPAAFQTRFLDDRVFIDDVYRSELVNKGIVKGTEILSVNGIPALEYGYTYRMPYVSASTPQSRISRTFETFEFTKDRTGNPMRLEVRTPDGNVFSLDITKRVRWDLQRNSPFVYHTTEDNMGVLRISAFWGGNMDQEFDKLYEEILKTDGLVIDLRNNTGGNSGHADYILRHLSDTPIRQGAWSSPMYVAALASWGNKPEKYYREGDILQPLDKTIYSKPITLLVNGSTYSAAEDFCADFRGMNRGKIIGTPTAGSTGNGIELPLIPGMINVWICTKDNLAADGSAFARIGIIPDIEVKENASDYLAGRDLLLEKALESLGKSK